MGGAVKLEDLEPRLREGILVFNCPCGDGGRLRVPTQQCPADAIGKNKSTWTISGEMPNVTLTPSVDAGCWHGFITNGEVVTA